MYESFYGLSGKPFQLNPDPAFFFGSRGHNRAFAYLQYGLYQGEGFIVITGEIGAGKTTIVRSLMEQLDHDEGGRGADRLARSSTPTTCCARSASPSACPSAPMSKSVLLASIEAFLCQVAVDRKRALLIVDEAQNLTPRAVEELRMLSNFQLGDQALLQSFLVGQPELRAMMQSPSMQQLRQRVIASYHLGPLDAAETQAYIEHRLHHVGWNDDPRFSPARFTLIHSLTGGIPRRINTLCNRLMLAAFLGEKHVLDADGRADDRRRDADELGHDLRVAHRRLRDESGITAPSVARITPAARAVDPPARGARRPRSSARVGATIDLLHSAAAPGRRSSRATPRSAEGDRSPATAAGAIACIVGARPNFMKMAPLIRAFAREPRAAARRCWSTPASTTTSR